MKNISNVAYIDAANLYNGISDLGWKLDYNRFRVWLQEKYSVKTAYLFIGLIPKNKELYKFLQECGYTLVFKEVVYDGRGKPKGNCDADLVLQATRDAYENNFNQSIVVSSDGDYSSLINFLKEKNKIKLILSPGIRTKCSILLKRTNVSIVYLEDKKKILSYKKSPKMKKPPTQTKLH